MSETPPPNFAPLAELELQSDSAPLPIRRWTMVLLTILLLGGVVAATYGRLFTAGFVGWDDDKTLRNNPAVSPPQSQWLMERWRHAHMRIYIPVTQTVWYALGHVAYQPGQPPETSLSPLPFHITNLLVHAISCVLLWTLLRSLGSTPLLAMVGALLFAVHPLQVESVAWLSGLKDLLAVMFLLLTMLAHRRVMRSGDGFALTCWTLAAVLAMALAVFSKPIAMIAPFMLLVIYCVEQKDGRWVRMVLTLLPLLILSLVTAYITYQAQPPRTDIAGPLLGRPLVAVASVGFYVSKLIAPLGLGFDYGLTPAAIRGSPYLLAGITALLALVSIVVLAWRRMPGVSAGILLFVLGLGPVLGLVAFDFQRFSNVSDHYVYPAMIGVSIALVSLLGAIHDNRRLSIAAGASVMLLSVLAVLSNLQTRYWRDAATLDDRTLAINQLSAAALSNKGNRLLRVGNHDSEAEAIFGRVIELDPNNPNALAGLGLIRESEAFTLQQAGDRAGEAAKLKLAQTLLLNAAKGNPSDASLRYDLARVLGKRGRVKEAVQQLQISLQQNPNNNAVRALLQQSQEFLRIENANRAATRPATRPSAP